MIKDNAFLFTNCTSGPVTITGYRFAWQDSRIHTNVDASISKAKANNAKRRAMHETLALLRGGR